MPRTIFMSPSDIRGRTTSGSQRWSSVFPLWGKSGWLGTVQNQQVAANQQRVSSPAVMWQQAKWPVAPDKRVTGWRKDDRRSCESHTWLLTARTHYWPYHRERVMWFVACMLIICLIKYVIIGVVKMPPLCLMPWLELRKLTLLKWLLPISGDSLTEG